MKARQRLFSGDKIAGALEMWSRFVIVRVPSYQISVIIGVRFSHRFVYKNRSVIDPHSLIA